VYCAGSLLCQAGLLSGLTLHGVINAVVLTTFFSVLSACHYCFYVKKTKPQDRLDIICIYGDRYGDGSAMGHDRWARHLYVYFYPPLKLIPLLPGCSRFSMLAPGYHCIWAKDVYGLEERKSQTTKTHTGCFGHMVKLYHLGSYVHWR
jgi:hypothetical protein